MLRFISTGLLCAASFISTHTFAASVSFDFMPHQSEVITNFTIFPIKATCLISLQNEQDNATLHVKALRREGTINNFPLKKGDEIATSGGLLGKITEVGDNFIIVEISKETEVKIQKQSVSIVYPKGTLKTL